MNKISATEMVTTLAMRCLTAAKARDAIVARCKEIREAGIVIGDVRSCALAQTFMKVFHGNDVKHATAKNYLSAVRRSVNDGAPFDLNPAQTAAKAAKVAKVESAEEGEETEDKPAKPARTPMSLAERLRRVKNDDGFAAFAAFADKLAKTGTPIATIIEQYVAANA